MDGDKEKSFTKGEVYVSESKSLNHNTKVYDDKDEVHVLGSWFTHFKQIG